MPYINREWAGDIIPIVNTGGTAVSTTGWDGHIQIRSKSDGFALIVDLTVASGDVVTGLATTSGGTNGVQIVVSAATMNISRGRHKWDFYRTIAAVDTHIVGGWIDLIVPDSLKLSRATSPYRVEQTNAPAAIVGVTDGDKGDISVTVSGATWTIDPDVVTNAKLANMATASFKARAAVGTGDPEDLTGTQATALLDVFASSTKGMVPASGGGTANFLRADGSFAAPPGSGTASWGSITGTLSVQTDLQAALDAKQPLDSDLTEIAGLTATTDSFIQSKASAWAARTIAEVKTDLGLTGTNTGDQTSIVGITGTKAQFDAAVTDGNFLYAGDVTQYTDEQAQDAVGAMIDGSLAYVDATPLLQRAALTGDVTAAAGSNVTAISADAVTNTMLANMAGNTMKGRPLGSGTGDPQDLSTAQSTALLDAATTSLKGLMSSADKTKLDGVATGATANSSDAVLLARANHTGTQIAATVSDFSEAVDDRVAALVVAGSNIAATYNDTANTLTLATTGSIVVSGYLVTNRNSLTLVNGTNASIVVNQSYIRASGPTAAFSIDGITVNNTDGQHLYLFNTTAQAMTIKHESSGESTATRKIKCLTGADVVLPARNTIAKFVYDGAISRWIFVGSIDAASGTNTGDETAAGILAKLITVDGAGSGLDADLLDGQSSAAFAAASHTHTASQVSDSTTAGRAMLTAADVAAQTALLNVATTALKGLVPVSGGGTANFLRADMTFAAPPGAATWTSYTASLGDGRGAYEFEATVTDALVASTSVIELRLAATASTDENEPELTNATAIIGRPATGSFLLNMEFAERHSGPIKLQYRIS